MPVTSGVEHERQACRICWRATLHEVTIAPGGRLVASVARCLEHREFTSGRIDVLGLDGQWRTIVERAS